jgi:hydrogenase expression/formation protein HypE
LGLETDLESDVAPLNHIVADLLAVTDQVRVMRDPTRGGVATTLNEIARQSQVAIVLDERTLPVRQAVKAACEMLGFDPLYIANEGKFLAVVGREEADKALAALRAHPYGRDAAIIGEVRADPKGRVLMKTAIGSTRVVDVLAGEMLPRIC